MITIRNSFTGRETRIRAKVGDVLPRKRILAIRSRLHAPDCQSGGELGERGPQSFTYDWTSDGCVKITG